MKREAIEWLLVGALAISVSVVNLAFMTDALLNFIMPVQGSSVLVAPVELGSLRPGEKRNAKARIQNLSWRTVRLGSPISSCGCTAVKRRPITLPPRGETELEISFLAPNSPGTVAKVILVPLAGDSRFGWKIPIKAQVTAKIWAEPAKVAFETSDQRPAMARILVHHDKSIGFDSISCDSPDVQLTVAGVSADIKSIDVKVTDRANRGAALTRTTIEVHADDNGLKQTIEIPVTWRAAPLVKVFPPEVSLTHFMDEVMPVRRSIILRGLMPEHDAELRAVPRQPWLTLVRKERVGRLVHLEIEFGPSSPSTVSGPILDVMIGDEILETINAIGSRDEAVAEAT